MALDLQILELACSRLCHDLISPIGAVGNGLELMAEEGDDELLADAHRLVESSARRASALLQLYRSAYGNAGNQAAFGLAEAARLVRESIDGGRIELRADLPADTAWPRGFGKLAVNAMLTAMEWLPRGGILSLAATVSGDRGELKVAVEGQQAAFSDETARLIRLDRQGIELTAHNIQPYLTGLIAAHHGYRLDASQPAAGTAVLAARPAA
ncbi:MAG TPA: histidine phosphotransferase family protein [Candidatus Cybelea sp.]|nr:histidine phosphotransferase family protein [Candidatus Cybelea sp.]